MISDMEIALLAALRDRLQTAEDSDRVREGRALQALLEAHSELKKPHVQALSARMQPSALRGIADDLDAAVESARSSICPDQTHKEALKVAALTAGAAIRQIAEGGP